VNENQRTPDPAPELAGFTYQRVLGVGGYSTVFLYEQERPRRPVAVKVLLADGMTREGIASFESEANIMAALSAHPNIVTILGADMTEDGRPYLVMEYYPGQHMGDRARHERLPVSEVLEVVVQVASALESAHRAGILHRDIKPANVLSSAIDRPGLTDFGISVLAAHSGPSSVDSVDEGMSIPWSPPEAFRANGELDASSDIYSLGALVYTLLAGRSPYEGPDGVESALALVPRILEGSPPPTGRADVPPRLEELLQQSLSRAPEHRPESALQFAHELQEIEEDLGLPRTRFDVLDVAVAEPPTTIAKAPVVEITAPRGAAALCAACGESLSTGTRFCKRCGEPVARARPVNEKTATKEREAPPVPSVAVAADSDPLSDGAPADARRRSRMLTIGVPVALLTVVVGAGAAVVAAQGGSESIGRASVDVSAVPSPVATASASPPINASSTTPSDSDPPITPTAPTPSISPTAWPTPTTERAVPIGVVAAYREGSRLTAKDPLGTDYSVRITWENAAPADGGEPAAHVITLSSDGRAIGSVETLNANSYDWMSTDGELRPETTYTVTVAAANDSGDGEASAVATFRTPTGYVRPTPPSNSSSGNTTSDSGGGSGSGSGSKDRDGGNDDRQNGSGDSDILPQFPGGGDGGFAD